MNAQWNYEMIIQKCIPIDFKIVKRTFIYLPAIVLSISVNLEASSDSKHWNRWKTSLSSSDRVINHNSWQDFLLKYLDTSYQDGINRISYSKVSDLDRKKLEHYIFDLQSVKVTSLNRNEQLAYWINLYNAATVSVVLNSYPIKSIRDINLTEGKSGMCQGI